MINAPDRRRTVELIEEAVDAGASPKKACEVLEISSRTYKRWTQEGEVKADGRPNAERPEPANKLTPEEKHQVLEICNEEAWQSLPPDDCQDSCPIFYATFSLTSCSSVSDFSGFNQTSLTGSQFRVSRLQRSEFRCFADS